MQLEARFFCYFTDNLVTRILDLQATDLFRRLYGQVVFLKCCLNLLFVCQAKRNTNYGDVKRASINPLFLLKSLDKYKSVSRTSCHQTFLFWCLLVKPLARRSRVKNSIGVNFPEQQ